MCGGRVNDGDGGGGGDGDGGGSGYGDGDDDDAGGGGCIHSLRPFTSHRFLIQWSVTHSLLYLLTLLTSLMNKLCAI